uniref:Disease resistance protein n=1 Tax=Quercus lobata TaxID=97700 RepID=A0A7N2MTG4_QUELO
MEKVRRIGSEFYSYSDGSYRNTTTLFPALRILKLVEIIALEEWKDVGEVLVFPCLKEFTISYCNELRDLLDSLHTCVSLQKLMVWECPELRYWPENELSKIDHIPFVDIQDSGWPDCSDFEDQLRKLARSLHLGTVASVKSLNCGFTLTYKMTNS